VKFKGNTTIVESADPATARGSILSKKVEIHGRPVSFVLLENGGQGLPSGEMVELDRPLLERTLTWRLLETGVAYYTVYTSTPLRDRLRAAALKARNAHAHKGRGVWAQDSSHEFRLVNQDSIGPEGTMILPKLFRRCTDYLKAVDQGFVGELSEWMIANQGAPRRENDRVVLTGGIEVRF